MAMTKDEFFGRPLFEHWRDLTNAEWMNHRLLVLTENAELATSAFR
jgi:hypothetical protein